MPDAPTTTRLQTRQQRFSQVAHACVTDVPSSEQETFKRFAQQFPALVHQCGLAQAVAFAAAKGHTRFLAAVEKVAGRQPNTLLKDAREAELTHYLRLTRDVMTAAEWLKRFSEALIETK